MKRLCTICARGGSKGLKNKNIRLLMGKPLIAHSIEQAMKSNLFDFIAVSSDSQEILDTAKTWGADRLVLRPAHLATDNAGKISAIRQCAKEIERSSGESFDVFVDLDCTAPLRTNDDIFGAVRLLEENGASNVITGSPARRSPYFNLVELDANERVFLSKRLDQPILARQNSPKCYDMNASIYVWSRKALLNEDGLFLPDTRLYIMPEERSFDIDTILDFEIVQFLAERNLKNYTAECFIC